LPWFAEALRLEQGDPFREGVHRTRLAVALKQCPELPAVWFHAGRVTDAAFSPDGRMTATAGDRGEVQIWDVARPTTPIQILNFAGEVNRIRFNPDGDRLLVRAGGHVAVCSLGASSHNLDLPHSQAVTAAVWLDQGRSVLTASADGTARIWNAETAMVTSSV